MLSQIPGLPSSAKEPVTTQISGTVVASGSSSQPAATAVAREREKARALNREGSRLLAMGKPAEALEKWEEAEELYRKIGDRMGIIGSQLNQAQALEALGHYTRSCDRILAAFGSEYKCEELTENKLAQELDRFQLPDSDSLNFIGLQSLGNMLRKIGKLDESEAVLNKSFARDISKEKQSQVLLNLGNTALAKANKYQDIENTSSAKSYNIKALKLYRKAAELAQSSTTKLEAKLNQLRIELEEENIPKSSIINHRKLLSEIKLLLTELPQSQMAVYAKINLACSLIGCDRVYAAPGSKEALQWPFLEIEQLLSTAIGESEILQNERFQSLAIGTLGTLYEKTGELRKAESMTEKALELAEFIHTPDLAYQWQWQMGRLLRQDGDVKGAIAYYRAAIQTMDSVRRDLFNINDVEFSFRVKVEPVYRQLVNLLLKAEKTSDPNEKVSLIKGAVEVIDSLQLAELENYLDCNFFKKKTEVEGIDKKAAIIYPILFPDRLEILFKLPGKSWGRHTERIDKSEVEDTIKQLQNKLQNNPAFTSQVKEYAQKIYNWLILPIAPDIEKLKENGELTTLVFGLDNSLKNIPMAVLYNNGHYLVEKYAIAVLLSQQIFNSQPREGPLKVLTAGVAKKQFLEGQEFEKLKNVPKELEGIWMQTRSPNPPLLDMKFIETELKEQISSGVFPIVHIATHGQFSSDPDETFIVAWEKLIKVKDFDEILQVKNPDRSQAIELLVLSACETAQGNKRAALGLAGIAAKARVRSTVATLWQVDDQRTSELMSKFYENLKNDMTIAEALQQAQKFILDQKEDRPYYWASYILVGNWL